MYFAEILESQTDADAHAQFFLLRERDYPREYAVMICKSGKMAMQHAVTVNEALARRLYGVLAKGCACPEHLQEIVSDFLGKEYAIR